MFLNIKSSIFVLVISLSFVLGPKVYAQGQSAITNKNLEQLGEIELADFLVEPGFVFTESQANSTEKGFSLGSTYFAAKWKLQRKISGRLQLGSYDLVNRPTWSPNTESGLGFVEAYAQYETSFGIIRAGRIPLVYGNDGSLSETEIWFPRTLIFRERLLSLRDLGASFSITHNGFFTDVAAHNGEGGVDQDHRYWMTGRWGWNGPAGIRIGVSGVTGRYLTNSSQSDVKVRMGNVFAALDLYNVGFALEFNSGEYKSFISKYQIMNWNATVRHGLGRDWGLLARYEFYDPSNQIVEDSRRLAMGGIYMSNDTGTSRLSFLFIKNWEEVEQTANDEYRLTWKITSAYF